MRLKTLAMFSSFLFLGSLIVCVSVYAYNAYANKSVRAGSYAIWGASNNSNLDDGYITAYARVGTKSRFQNKLFGKEEISFNVVKFGSVSLSGSAIATVTGYDSNGKSHSKLDECVHTPDPDW